MQKNQESSISQKYDIETIELLDLLYVDKFRIKSLLSQLNQHGLKQQTSTDRSTKKSLFTGISIFLKIFSFNKQQKKEFQLKTSETYNSEYRYAIDFYEKMNELNFIKTDIAEYNDKSSIFLIKGKSFFTDTDLVSKDLDFQDKYMIPEISNFVKSNSAKIKIDQRYKYINNFTKNNILKLKQIMENIPDKAFLFINNDSDKKSIFTPVDKDNLTTKSNMSEISDEIYILGIMDKLNNFNWDKFDPDDNLKMPNKTYQISTGTALCYDEITGKDKCEFIMTPLIIYKKISNF